MNLSEIFIGRLVYWALLAAIVAILTFLGIAQQHVREFVPFIFILLGLSVTVVAIIVLTYRPGERITREPIEDDASSGS